MMRNLKKSFAPVVAENAVILVLGSMPGEISLQKNQYYAHPANLFWHFFCEAAQISYDIDYKTKVAAVKARKIAIWDVLKQCEREGSLDSNIKHHSEQANDLPAFLEKHRNIKKICFNGQKAFVSFKKHVFKMHPEFAERFAMVVLPSTSPANASIPRSVKKQRWFDEVWKCCLD
jgi:hypoxanthine-DNA glycosylase